MQTIDRLEIINFQKHSKLNIDFVKGVNVICGASRTGKSCLRRSIDWVVNNKKIDAVRKEGTKKTSVKIFFSDNIILEKVRSSSINRYILTVNGKESEFNSIGKEIPQEIKDVINLNPIEIDKESINLNIAEQITLPFLLDKPGSFRMKLFNLLTGNELQDKLLGAFNKSLLNVGRSVKSQDEIVEKSKDDLIEIEKERNNYQKIVDSFKIHYERVKKLKERLDKLTKIQEELEINEEEIEIAKEQLKSIKTVNVEIFNQAIQKAKKLEKLESLRESLVSNEKEIKDIRAKIGEIRLTEVDFIPLQAKIERLNTLKSWIKDNNALSQTKKETEIALEEVEIEFEGQETEYKRLLEESKICPTCNNPITEECLERIKL